MPAGTENLEMLVNPDGNTPRFALLPSSMDYRDVQGKELACRGALLTVPAACGARVESPSLQQTPSTLAGKGRPSLGQPCPC